jgi:hypothetical protein
LQDHFARSLQSNPIHDLVFPSSSGPYSFLDESTTLLLTGKTLPIWKLLYSKADGFVRKFTVPLLVGGGAVSLFYVFGVGNAIIFLMQSLSISSVTLFWIVFFNTIAILAVLFVTCTIVFIRTRRKKINLYPEILRVFVLNRVKIENFIGTSFLFENVINVLT